MLNSNIDRNIKRFLSKIGELTRQSKLYNSCYYLISYPADDVNLTIRFADHFSDRERKERILEIIKNNDFYTIKDSIIKFSVTLTKESIVKYLNCYLLIYPDLVKPVQSHIEAAHKAEYELNAIKAPFGEAKERIKLMSEEINKLNEDCLALDKKCNKYRAKLVNIKQSLNNIE